MPRVGFMFPMACALAVATAGCGANSVDTPGTSTSTVSSPGTTGDTVDYEITDIA